MSRLHTYNFPTQITGAYFNGLGITLFSDEAKQVPIDLSGSLIRMALRPKYSLPIVWTFSSGSDGDGTISIPSPTNGRFIIDGINLDVAPGKYFYDIEILDYSGDLQKWIKGEWIILNSAND